MTISRRFSLFLLVALLMALMPVLAGPPNVAWGAEDQTSYTPWSFAVLSDLHIGREFSDYGGPGYNDSGTLIAGEAAANAQAAVAEINRIKTAKNIAFVVVLGDLTDSAEASELKAARAILDRLSVPWIPLPGNHDVWPSADNIPAPATNPPADSYFHSIIGTEYTTLASAMSGWGKQSPALVRDSRMGYDTYFENFYFDRGGFHFIGLDFNRTENYRQGDLHQITNGTWPWFTQHIRSYVNQHPEGTRDIVLLAHHPLVEDRDRRMTFSDAELAQLSAFAHETYSFVDSLGQAQTRTYASRIWGQLAGHTHPWELVTEYPAWSQTGEVAGGPVVAYPRNFGGVSIGILKVSAASATGINYSNPGIVTAATPDLPAGTIKVSSNLDATFRISGTAGYSGTAPWSVDDAPPGTYTIRWGDMAGYTAPAGKTLSLANGGAIEFKGAYTARVKKAPTLSTDAASNVSAAGATINANLTSMGTAASVQAYFEWGRTGTYGNTTPARTRDSAGAFAQAIAGLSPGTTYHFRAVATGDGPAYGSDRTFTTLPATSEEVPPPDNGDTAPSTGTDDGQGNGNAPDDSSAAPPDPGPSGAGQPGISGVLASYGPGQNEISVTITGANLNASPISLDFGPDITVEDIEVIGDSELIARLSVAEGAARGPRDITITTSSGSCTFSAGFEVGHAGRLHLWLYLAAGVGALAVVGSVIAIEVRLRRRVAAPQAAKPADPS